MFVRIKRTRARRYAYLVEGRREGARVRQKVVCYLGPLSKVANGVPEQAKTAAALRGVDWTMVNETIRRIPLNFEELSEARRMRYPEAVEGRRQGFLTSGIRERVGGEGEALARISEVRFRQMFTDVGAGRYRMK